VRLRASVRTPRPRIAAAVLAAILLAGCGHSWQAQHDHGGPASGGASALAGARAATRRQLALATARALLGRLTLPAGGRVSSGEPAGSGDLLDRPLALPGGSTIVSVRRFATVPGRVSSVVRFIAAHPPAGSIPAGSGTAGSTGARMTFELTFSWPDSRPIFQYESLVVEAVQLRGGGSAGGRAVLRTGLEIVAIVEYYPARPRADDVAGGATEMTATLLPEGESVHASGRPVSTRDEKVIAAVIEAFDGAHPELPGLATCRAPAGGLLTLQFRRSPGQAPYATVVAETGGCETMHLLRDGRPVRPALAGAGFAALVEHLLPRLSTSGS
jgi:hypothetical protein